MSLEQVVLTHLREKPLSGGRLIEVIQAGGAAASGPALAVYGALANLRARGAIDVLAEGQGERVFGVAGTVAPPPAHPGFPPSFSLGAPELALIEKELWAMTRGLAPHYFEELRRAVVADADRRIFNGGKLPGAVQEALAAVGPRGAARAYLRKVEKGGPVSLRLTARPRKRWVVIPVAIAVLLVVLRLWVVGAYTLPHDSESMAPTLMPGAEGGDGLVLVNLLAPHFGDPDRGEVWVFRLKDRLFVKRVVGRPGDTMAVRRGNVLVNQRVIVKEREELDRVKVPLFDRSQFEQTDSGLRPAAAYNANTFRNPDGNLNRSLGICRDIVVRAAVRTTDSGGSVTFQVDNGWRGQEHVIVVGRTGLIAVAGETEATGPPLLLKPGETREIWFTNADGVFRVEVDGREIVRVELKDADKHAQLTVLAERAEVAELELARDLHYEWRGGPVTLEEDEYFVLGDNGANSRDSRQLGPIRREAFVGRAFAVAWPPTRVRAVR